MVGEMAAVCFDAISLGNSEDCRGHSLGSGAPMVEKSPGGPPSGARTIHPRQHAPGGRILEHRMRHPLPKRLFLQLLSGIKEGFLELVCPEETYSFGSPASDMRAMLVVHNERFYRRALFGGDIGMGEAFMDGDWSSPDLVAVVRLAVRNLDQVESSNKLFSALSSIADSVRHRLRGNTVPGSRRNISYHYDLGNDFYRLFLDPTMAYSCAFFRTPDDSLEHAQLNKYECICRKLDLKAPDHLLEIGTGWGGFAAFAASKYGCRITTTTISRQQHDYANELFAGLGSAGERITLLLEDYRNLRGRFDKIVSIEMFEAVGLLYYDTYVGACDRLLKSDGSMVLQTITINEQKFPVYRKRCDWIQKYIFPGSELASVAEIFRSSSTTVVDRRWVVAIRAYGSDSSWRGIDVVFATRTNAAGAQCRATRAIAMR